MILIKLNNFIQMQKKEDHDFLYKSTNRLVKLFYVYFSQFCTLKN